MRKPRRAGGGAPAPPGLKRPSSSLRSRLPKPGTEKAIDLEKEAFSRWEKGYTVGLHRLDPRLLERGLGLVIVEGRYYHKWVQVAGQVAEVTMSEGATYLRMKPSGTTGEELLKFLTGHPGRLLRVHLCGQECNQEEASEDLVHALVGRPMKEEKAEDPWVQSLQKAEPREGDELAQLRAVAGLDQGEVPRPGEAPGGVEAEANKAGEKEKKKKKKDRRVGKKKKKRGSSPGAKVSSDEGVRVDGSHPRLANQKKTRALFEGTGLDPRDRVRNKVARRARRHFRRKSEKSSSSSSESQSESKSSEGIDQTEESIFEQASKVRVVAEHYPGALAGQAVSQMRATLLQEVGYEDRPNVLHPVGVPYFRQQLQKRATGPTSRELLTLSYTLDQLLRGRAASAADALVQRIKSIEQTMAGSHWSVSQRLEVLPGDSVTLTAVPEATAAQKEVYQEAKARWYATFPEGRVAKGAKGQGKGRGEGKDKGGSGAEGGKKGGKGNKGESAKKKD